MKARMEDAKIEDAVARLMFVEVKEKQKEAVALASRKDVCVAAYGLWEVIVLCFTTHLFDILKTDETQARVCSLIVVVSHHEGAERDVDSQGSPYHPYHIGY
jgi:hypothetical protein